MYWDTKSFGAKLLSGSYGVSAGACSPADSTHQLAQLLANALLVLWENVIEQEGRATADGVHAHLTLQEPV